MIGKITRGQRVGGLVRYLFGPGDANEHTDPRVVAGWDEPAALEPVTTPAGRADFRPLIDQLNMPMAGVNTRKQCVWHCSLRAAPGDRTLSDAEWRDVAEEIMDSTGLAPRGDDGGCRWIAVRHDDDHVHLVATLARQDGGRARDFNDRWKVLEGCRRVEARYGLQVVAMPDRTVTAETRRSETEKAARPSPHHADTGLAGEPARDRLRREVQLAAAGASGTDDFFDRLRTAGVMVEARMSTQHPDQATGYKVAWPRYCNRDGRPVWFGGGKLAPDLSLPRLEKHWRPVIDPAGWRNTAAGGGERPHSPTAADRMSLRVRLRHDVERAASTAAGPDDFFARLRAAGVLVRERYSDQRPDELTGYAVGYDEHRTDAGDPVWYGGGKLSPDLSLPRLHARWTAGTTNPPDAVPGAQGAFHRPVGAVRPGSRPQLAPDERAGVIGDARAAATAATDEVRAGTDPDAAADAARAAADALRAAARLAEPRGRGPFTEAADSYAQAGREGGGRTPPRGRAGADLRLAATSLLMLSRLGTNDNTAFLTLAASLVGLVEAVRDLRSAQGRTAQATAAQRSATLLRSTTPSPTAAAAARAAAATAVAPTPTWRPPGPTSVPDRGPRR